MKYQSNCPHNMIQSIFQKKIIIASETIETKWWALQKRETFVKSQIPPYKVEFDHSTQVGIFEKNELNIHHGPFLHLPAVVGDVENNYRDLKYLYGAYVLSFRYIRPVRLEFFRHKDYISLKLTSYVHPLFRYVWPMMNQFFWFFFRI